LFTSTSKARVGIENSAPQEKLSKAIRATSAELSELLWHLRAA
jgi:hypothetical protein